MRLFLLFLLPISLFCQEVTRSYDFNYIREFIYIGAGKIEIKQGERNRLTLTAEEALMDNTLLADQRGILSLAPKDPFFTGRFPGIMKGVLEVKELRKIELNGSVSADIDHLKGEDLTIELLAEGSSLIEGALELEKLSLSIVGSAEAVLRGNAEEQSVFITGAGAYAGENFVTKKSMIHIQGAGTAFVNATEILNALIIGYGHVHYVGTPKINDKISGQGKVSPYVEGMKR
ncbi:MAG: DUF2807 domain-containing protein [Chlamydiales bacterium]|nr:DUF2807 domain-containing protein [Chlamydiales bacterium]